MRCIMNLHSVNSNHGLENDAFPRNLRLSTAIFVMRVTDKFVMVAGCAVVVRNFQKPQREVIRVFGLPSRGVVGALRETTSRSSC